MYWGSSDEDAQIYPRPFSHLQEMSNFPLLLDKMDNRVIHDIVAIIVLIEVIIVTVYHLWSHHHHHQWVATEITAWTTNGVSFILQIRLGPTKTTFSFPAACAALHCVVQKYIVLCKVALVTVLHTLHPVQFTMRFSEGSLCHKLRPAVKIRWENGGRGGSRSCEGGGVEHYEHYGRFRFFGVEC